MGKISEKILQLEEQLTGLLGKKSYTRSKRACAGKWQGTYDYRLLFDDGTYCFISNGMKDYERNLLTVIREILYFNDHKEYIEQWIKTVLDINNKQIEDINYTFDKVYMITDSGYLGYIVFDYYVEPIGAEKKLYTYVESGFSCYCKDLYNQQYIEDKMINGFPLDKAGGIKEKHFIFT